MSIELVPGKVYFFQSKETANHWWIRKIAKVNDDGSSGSSLKISDDNYFNADYGTLDNHDYHIRPATQEEIKWLEACEKAKKLVSRQSARNMSETNLEKAIRLYPISTVYIGVKDRQEHAVIQPPREFESTKNIDAGEDYIYFQGEWAEIVSTSESRNPSEKESALDIANRKYPIGSRYIGLRDKIIYEVTHPAKYVSTSGNIEMGVDYVFYEGQWAEMEIPSKTKEPSMNEILVEAKKRYPAGTKYYPAHLVQDNDALCTVDDPNNFHIADGQILESTGNRNKNGHYYSEIVWYKGKWAPIKTAPESNLEKAARLYPIGTRYVSAFNPSRRDIEIATRAPRDVNISGNIDVGLGYIYYNGEWAEIVQSALDETIELPVGNLIYGSPGVSHEDVADIFRSTLPPSPKLNLEMKELKKVELPLTNKKSVLNLNLTIKKRGL